MDRDVTAIQFTPEERSLIHRYGYPFEKLEQALRSIPSGVEIATIRMDAYDLEMLIGELSRSFNHGESECEEVALLDLCTRLERAQNTRDGTLDILM